jgi:hypothetical protein
MAAGTAGDLYGNQQDAAQELDILAAGSIPYYLKNGQGFVVNGRGLTSTTANLFNCALSLFNPAASGKTLLVYSLRAMVSTTANTLSQWNLTTTDPGNSTGITTQLTPVHLPGATSPSTVATAWQTANNNTTTVTAPGTKAEEFLPVALQEYEILQGGAILALPAGNGIAVMLLVGTAGGYFQSCAKWVEV